MQGTPPIKATKTNTQTKRPQVNRLPILLIAFLMAACSHSQRGTIDDMSPEPVAAHIAQLLDEFHSAASKSDFDAYFRHWDALSVFLGTDATERWEGKGFKDFAKPYFEKGKGWTYRPRNRHVSVSPDARTAWFDELLDNDKYGECRGSGVFIRTDSGYILVQYNLSIPMPNDLAPEFTDKIRRFQKPHQE
jgi:hypothetical protein